MISKTKPLDKTDPRIEELAKAIFIAKFSNYVVVPASQNPSGVQRHAKTSIEAAIIFLKELDSAY